MSRVRRRTVRATRWQDEVWHLIDGRHADWEPGCAYTDAELAALWDEHRNDVWDEFDRGRAEGRGDFVPWGAVRFDGVPGEVRPARYPYHHLGGDAA